jgi:hypothetical protein
VAAESRRSADELAGHRIALRDMAEENAELRGNAAGGGNVPPAAGGAPLNGGFPRGADFQFKSGSFFDKTPFYLIWGAFFVWHFFIQAYLLFLGLDQLAAYARRLLSRVNPVLGEPVAFDLETLGRWFRRNGYFRLVCEQCRGGGSLRGVVSMGAFYAGGDDDVRAESLRVQEGKYRAFYAKVRFFEYDLGLGGLCAALCPRLPFWYHERVGYVCVELLTHLTTASNIDFHSTPDVVCERLKLAAKSFNVVNLDKSAVLAGAAVVQDTWLTAFHYYLQIREEREKELGFLPRPFQIV